MPRSPLARLRVFRSGAGHSVKRSLLAVVRIPVLKEELSPFSGIGFEKHRLFTLFAFLLPRIERLGERKGEFIHVLPGREHEPVRNIPLPSGERLHAEHPGGVNLFHPAVTLIIDIENAVAVRIGDLVRLHVRHPVHHAEIDELFVLGAQQPNGGPRNNQDKQQQENA